MISCLLSFYDVRKTTERAYELLMSSKSVQWFCAAYLSYACGNLLRMSFIQ